MLHNIRCIAKKELTSFFASPVAFIFLGAFLATTLFTFFWVETFFARNISDARPLFEWMPLLLIFLVAALTMRMWSEERRSGTIELLFTKPISSFQWVCGKFMGCMALIAIALLLTLPIPITVSMLGNLDWGPVLGAYIACLFLGAAYTSIGLTISANSENQIVSLITTVLAGLFLYGLGTDVFAGLFDLRVNELLRLLGSGSRFSSITRGVIDVRDIYYYISIVGIFMSLNIYCLEKIRINKGHKSQIKPYWSKITLLFILNFVFANAWLFMIQGARIDLTEGRIYSLSSATKTYLSQLEEPLLIRGYFSPKTHPLLSPLVPQLRDLIKEYELAGQGKIRVEIINPLESPELEEEAGRKYGIKPVPFQVSDKYQAALVNSYFNVVVEYGDQFEVLGFRELIEVQATGDTDINVQLRNPEYDITKTIKKVMQSFQGEGNLFNTIQTKLSFNSYISTNDKLPEPLIDFKNKIQEVIAPLIDESKGKLQYSELVPEANNGLIRAQIEEEFGFKAMQVNLFDTETFYFYLLLSDGYQHVQIPLPEGLDIEAFKRSLDSGLKRFSKGFLKTIALHTNGPDPNNPYAQYGNPHVKNYQFLTETLNENHLVVDTDLSSGQVPDEADILMLVAPTDFNEKQLYAVDQFLMKGGTVLIASSPYSATLKQGHLNIFEHTSGIESWLDHHGISMEKQLILDPQNTHLPVPINRQIGGLTVQEIQMIPYPYFLEVRGKGIKEEQINSGLQQVSMSWSSPITFKQEQSSLKVTPLLYSSDQSWLSDSKDILPNFEQYSELGFKQTGVSMPQLIAMTLEGRFTSFFKGKTSPLLTPAEAKEDSDADSSTSSPEAKSNFVSAPIEMSPESGRIILFSSNEFLTDQTLKLIAGGGTESYLNGLRLMENAVDWSLEDNTLLSIRHRGQFSRTLVPLSRDAQHFWEYLNYGIALLALACLYFIFFIIQRNTQRRYAIQLTGDAK